MMVKSFPFLFLLMVQNTCCSVLTPPCPHQCTCDVYPLHAAPFLTSWIKGSQQEQLWSQNDVLAHASSGEAVQSGVSLEDRGLHVTCAIYHDTNITHTLQLLPADTMVLSLLQAASNNYTVIDGDELASLTYLKALHIKGFSAYNEKIDGESDKVSLILTDDALRPLLNLQILDLTHVRLVPKKVVQRLRRHVNGPFLTINMLDMPLSKFLQYTNDLDINQIPRSIQKSEEQLDSSRDPSSNLKEYSVVLLNNRSHDSSVTYKSTENEISFTPFTSQVNLKYLRIAYAHLEELRSEIFVGLINLRSVVLEHNGIKILPADIFAHTPNVRYLNLGYNSILSLDPKSLEGLSRLLSLNLQYNRLAVTGPSTLPFLPSLKNLNLKGNPIRNILPDSFIFVNSTEKLTLGSLLVSTEIRSGAFNKLTQLKELKIFNYTALNFRGDIFTGIPNLEELTLHGSIPIIDFDAFTNVPKLKKLHLSHTELSKISVDAFFGLSDLIHLDLSHNNISEIIPGTFDHLKNVEELYLNNNNLSTLAIGLFTPLKAKILRLNYNPWHCSCTFMQLRPEMTNTIITPAYKMCYLDSKGKSMCEMQPETIRYDARVAPKCETPEMYKHKDVHTVAHRYLKCSKYHWDPLTYTDEPTTVKATETTVQKVQSTMTPRRRVNRINWRPLIDFTPMPLLPKDLLNIAERDQLEEVEEEIPVATTVLPQSDHSEIRNEVPIDPSADKKAEYLRRKEEEIARYRANKEKIKEQMRLQRIQEQSNVSLN